MPIISVPFVLFVAWICLSIFAIVYIFLLHAAAQLLATQKKELKSNYDTLLTNYQYSKKNEKNIKDHSIDILNFIEEKYSISSVQILKEYNDGKKLQEVEENKEKEPKISEILKKIKEAMFCREKVVSFNHFISEITLDIIEQRENIRLIPHNQNAQLICPASQYRDTEYRYYIEKKS